MKKICYLVTIPLTIRAFFIPQLKKLSEVYDVSVICGPDDKLKDELGENIHYISVDIPRGVNLLKTIKAILVLRKQFKIERYDLVQYSTPNAAFCASIAAKLAGIKVRNYHLMGLRYLGAHGIGRQILKALEKISCKFSTHIECVSKSNYELGVQEGLYSHDKVVVVWNGSSGGVDLKRFDISKRAAWRTEVRHELGLLYDDFVFGFAGRITKDKGINEILDAFLKLKNNSKCLIIGNREGIDTIDQKLWKEASENPDIIIHDSVTDIERYYAAMDVLLLPSYREGFGNVVIEAGAMGVPAVVSNIPGPTDAVVNETTGLIVECKDTVALEKVMNQMIENDSYTVMGKEAHEYVITHFDGAVLCDKIMERKFLLIGD